MGAMGRRSVGALLACGVAMAVLTGCGSSGNAAPAATSSSAVPASPAGPGQSTGAAPQPPSGVSSAQQQQYCVAKGGQVQTRQAYWGTNGDQTSWLALAGTTTMCRFQSDDQAKSRIYVNLTTLASPVPTLAALAYLSMVPLPPSTGGATPVFPSGSAAPATS